MDEAAREASLEQNNQKRQSIRKQMHRLGEKRKTYGTTQERKRTAQEKWQKARSVFASKTESFLVNSYFIHRELLYFYLRSDSKGLLLYNGN